MLFFLLYGLLVGPVVRDCFEHLTGWWIGMTVAALPFFALAWRAWRRP